MYNFTVCFLDQDRPVPKAVIITKLDCVRRPSYQLAIMRFWNQRHLRD